MTPEQAQRLLAGITPGPWRVCELENQPAGCPAETDFWIENQEQNYIAEKTVSTRRADTVKADFDLIAAATEMAAHIANMTPEYCIEIQIEPGDPWQKVTMWHPGNPLRPGHTLATNERIRTRYVTKPQPLGDQQ